ncbi:MAG: hypothetical protein ACI9EF_001728 [Pseudohongiellaceae bacterium]|jgi:hypothetical protein
MSATRFLCVAAGSITLISALWVSNAQSATPNALLPAVTLANNQLQDAAAAEVLPFKPVARISSLMTGLGTATGKIRDALEQTDDEHRLKTIKSWSEVIAELSNVHTQHRRKPDYIEMAANTRTIAIELARAARSETPDEALLGALFTKLDNSCATCHESDH